MIRDTAKDIPHPTDANRTLWDARNDDGIFIEPASSAKDIDAVRLAPKELEIATASVDDFGVGPLGSGSDFTVFLQRIGVSIIRRVPILAHEFSDPKYARRVRLDFT